MTFEEWFDKWHLDNEMCSSSFRGPSCRDAWNAALKFAQQPHGGSPVSPVHPNAEAALPHAADVVKHKTRKG